MMNRGLWGSVWIKWEDCLYPSAVYATNVLGTPLDNSASMLGPWNFRLHGKLNIVSILGYRYIFMSTVNNSIRAVKTSGTDVLSSWKKLRKTSEGAGGGGVVATSLVRPYVRGLLWARSIQPKFRPKFPEILVEWIAPYVKIWGRQLPIRFNFWSKNQLRKNKDRILINYDVISNKWKYKTKEARLILQSGIYICIFITFGN